MILRLLALFLIVWFLIWLIRKQFSLKTGNRSADIEDQSEDMLACKTCGTHVPRSLAVYRNDNCYCSEEHADHDER